MYICYDMSVVNIKEKVRIFLKVVLSLFVKFERVFWDNEEFGYRY